MCNLFDFGHKKGEHDGGVACVKRDLFIEQVKFEEKSQFKNVHAIIEWYNIFLSIGSSHVTPDHYFGFTAH